SAGGMGWRAQPSSRGRRDHPPGPRRPADPAGGRVLHPHRGSLPMRRSFTSEWLKLRRRGMLAALATVIAITGLVTFLTISHAGGSGRGPGDHAFLSLAAARGANGLAL